MKNNMDNLLREKINNLDSVPPGITRDKEASWEKIKKNQKAIARKTDFIKKTLWGIILAAAVSGVFLFYGFEKSEEVRKAEKENVSPAGRKSEMQLKEESKPVDVKPDPLKRKTIPEKTIAPGSVPGDTSINIIAPIDGIKPTADKQKEVNTIKIPKVETYPSLIDNPWEEDFRSVIVQQDRNLVRNGTFEQGNAGFKSDFRFLPHEAYVGLGNGTATPVESGSYIITDSFSYSDSLGSSILMSQSAVNPVPSTGSFLEVNINISGKQRVWYDSITIKPNTTYSFSCLLANVSTLPQWHNPENGAVILPGFGYAQNPGALKLCVNGEKVSRVLDLPRTHEWRSLSGTFTSGPDQTRIEISIEDIISPIGNNLVALDNIVFKEIPPVGLMKKKKRFPK